MFFDSQNLFSCIKFGTFKIWLHVKSLPEIIVNYKSKTFNNPITAYFLNEKYSVTIQSHTIQIVNIIFPIENLVLFNFLNIIDI